ncbi:hypothetical protein L8S96_20055, partial [Enterobacter roggenkampii]|uniref:hypothetical protein n=1 Tax=Enterobacter roggenkampii TaxID=1812935 RepID=UPI002004732C
IFRHGHSSGYSLTGSITTSPGGGLGMTTKKPEIISGFFLPGGATPARAYGFCRPGKAKPPPG